MITRSYMDTTTNPTGNSSFDVSSFVEEYLRSSVHSWSIGISGAIGEFMYDDEEEVEFRFDDSQLSVITPRGAIQIRLDSDIKCIAYEEVSSCTRSWSQNVVFCIPDSRAKLKNNNVLTYSGIDAYAIRDRDKDKHKYLFDLGVGSEYLQFCVRSSNENFVSTLRDYCGRSIFEPGNPVSAAILEHSPARVVVSALGRVEIETRIPHSTSETLVGPHTHLLPALLKAQRKITVEIPPGYVECLSLYPEHPVFDKYGEQHAFQESAHNKFQNLLSELGPDGYMLEKNRVKAKMLMETGKSRVSSEDSSLQYHVHRIARIQAPFLDSL